MKKFRQISSIILFCVISVILISIFSNKPADSSRDKQVIKFSSWGSQSETEILKNIINDYENTHNVKIVFYHIPQNYFQKLHLLFASGSEPDVIFINNQNIKMYTDAGLLENLSDYFPDYKTEYYKEATDCLSDDGKLYALPRDISGLVIFYNKDLFKKIGIDISELDSIEKLPKICEKIKQKGYYAFNYEDNPLYWLNFLSAHGGGAISDDTATITINSKQSIDALNLYSDFINKYNYLPSKARIGSLKPAQMFINGQLAMYVGGRWMVPKFRETIDFDWDVTLFPVKDSEKTYSDASGWAISKNSQNKNIAADFISALASEKSSREFAKSGLIIPARISVCQSEAFLDKTKHPYSSEVFIEMIKKSKPTPVNGNYPKINDILKEKAQKIFDSNKNAEEVFDEKTVKKLQSLL